MKWEEILDRLEHRLGGKLPGMKAHHKMAPSDRIHGIYPAKPDDKTTQGAVLILLYKEGNHLNTVLIQRPSYPGAHSDQIGFPGGKFEKRDGSLIHTATREVEEEIGIPARSIRIHGILSPLFIPVSNIEVTPVVGSISVSPELHPHPTEVKFTIKVNLADLSDPSIIREKRMDILGQRVRVPYFKLGAHHIWGATAMIICELIEILGPLKFNLSR